MSYKALYLKYRPQTFAEVAGQTPIVKTLQKSIELGKIAHAYLFSGPRGTGKTTMARLFAKALNCQQGIGKQCGECEDCRLIAEGTHPDVLEIDAASNNGVDQVRDLIEQVNYSPIKGRYKVYIIDEVHMMTDSAFNALLKTLEEPPENVVFILCTTEPHQVLPTILSRCQRYDFHPLSEEEMKEKLTEILQHEGAAFEFDALSTICELADGGMRDALSITDQLLAYSNNTLRLSDLLDVYGLASKEEKLSLLHAMFEGNATMVVGKTELYRNSGIDLQRLTKELIAYLKDTYVYSKTQKKELLVYLNEKEANSLLSLVNEETLIASLNILFDVESQYRFVDDARSLFELCLLRLTSTKKKEERKETENVTKKDSLSFEEKPSFEISNEEPSFVQVISKPVEEKKKSSFDLSSFHFPLLSVEGEEYTLPKETLIQLATRGNKEEKNRLYSMWSLLEEIVNEEKAGPYASLLLQGKPYLLCDECLVVQYDYMNQKKKANIIENQKPLAYLVECLLGRKVFLYGIEPSERADINYTFRQLQRDNALPKKEDPLEIPKID